MFDQINEVDVLWYAVMGLIGFVLVVVLIHWLLRRLRWLARSFWQKDEATREVLRSSWKSILSLARTKNIHELRQAVIQADALLDRALQYREFVGRTLGERLSSACHKYPELRRVWKAHRLRNTLVHEDHSIAEKHLHQALDSYDDALKALGVL